MAVVYQCLNAKVTFGIADVMKTVFKKFRISMQIADSFEKPSMRKSKAQDMKR